MSGSGLFRRFSLIVFVTGLVGCGSAAPAPRTGTEMTASGSNSEILAALSQLSPEDRQVAERQSICPVSDHALGSMGAPIKVSHDGQDVFLCCDGCKAGFEKEPQAYLAKVLKK